ncbi:Smr/MutS family protein [Flavobacterium sp. J372]|uniref:Smr/MutS family protein n=1 Tax=Flavobacterium sp. J372 TaxID=2898436 RepID=UPI0027E325D4|nr:Smr/MutS family protein [Flavobacterium sp. J372]
MLCFGKKKEPKNAVLQEKKSRKDDITLEIDLHIEKLVKKKGGMSNYEILTLQSETARRQLDFAIANRIPKVVFIHGVGEGVLKAELEFLFGRYDNIIVSEADYQKYGLGALQVYIKQNPKR